MNEQTKREMKVWGTTEAEMQAAYGPTSLNWRLSGPLMLAASIASDAQHLMQLGDVEQARQLLNRQKWVLFESIKLEAMTRPGTLVCKNTIVTKGGAQ